MDDFEKNIEAYNEKIRPRQASQEPQEMSQITQELIKKTQPYLDSIKKNLAQARLPQTNADLSFFFENPGVSKQPSTALVKEMLTFGVLTIIPACIFATLGYRILAWVFIAGFLFSICVSLIRWSGALKRGQKHQK